jgi:alcohol dehydrogenase class IV
VAYALAGKRDGKKAAERVEQLAVEIGLPVRLSACGVREDQIETLAAFAFKDLNWWTNPIQPTEAQLAEMYRAAF